MAKAKSTGKIELTVTLTLSESEARAMSALTTYGVDVFLAGYYKHCGKCYMEPHAQGLKSLFETIKAELPSEIKRVYKARAAFCS